MTFKLFVPLASFADCSLHLELVSPHISCQVPFQLQVFVQMPPSKDKADHEADTCSAVLFANTLHDPNVAPGTE